MQRRRSNRSKRRKQNLTIAAYIRISKSLVDDGVLPDDHLDCIMDWQKREKPPTKLLKKDTDA